MHRDASLSTALQHGGVLLLDAIVILPVDGKVKVILRGSWWGSWAACDLDPIGASPHRRGAQFHRHANAMNEWSSLRDFFRGGQAARQCRPDRFVALPAVPEVLAPGDQSPSGD